MNSKRLIISTFIVLIIGMQASTFITGTKVWPFMAYCMYAKVFYPPLVTRKYELTGITADGDQVAIDYHTVGLDYFVYKRELIVPLIEGDGQAAAQIAQRVSGPQPIVEITVQITKYELTEQGLSKTIQQHMIPVNETGAKDNGSQ